MESRDYQEPPPLTLMSATLMLLLKLDLIRSYLVMNLIFHNLVHLMTHTIDKHKESIRSPDSGHIQNVHSFGIY